MRKKYFMILLVLCLFSFVAPIYAADIYSCEASMKGVLIDSRIPEVVSTIVLVIKIVVPILLVIFGMIDLMKGLTSQKDEEIKKGQQIFVKRLISGALVFFVFVIVQLIISFAAADGEKTNIMTCAECFINGDCTYRKESNNDCPKVNDKQTILSENKNFCIEDTK